MIRVSDGLTNRQFGVPELPAGVRIEVRPDEVCIHAPERTHVELAAEGGSSVSGETRVYVAGASSD